MNAVIIFAKYPVDGKVKTRLGKTLGDEFATRLYRLMAEYIFNVCLALPKEVYDIHLFYENADEASSFEQWAPSDFSLNMQIGNNLGERMKSAFHSIFKKRYKKVIIIGTDCPQINVNIIVKAFNELSQNDLVMGPSADGGYYLLGMNEFHPFLFENVRWSSSEVSEKTKEMANEKGLNISLLPELIDIDTEDDLRDWLQTIN